MNEGKQAMKHYRHTSITLALLGSLALSAPASAQQHPQQAPARHYQVAAGPLGTVLSAFASDAGVSISGAASLYAGLHSRGLNGNYQVADGFARLLDGSGLYAVDQGGGHYAVRKLPSAADAATLPGIAVRATAERSTSTEGTGSYTTPATASATGLVLSLRETPQSVSVITRQRMDDQDLLTVRDVLRNTPGIAVNQFDTERSTFSARGFDVDNFQYDGVPTTYKVQYSGGESEMDSLIYDRVEVTRGATGLLTGAGYPSASINLVRKRASARQFEGQWSLAAGSWSDYRGTLDLATPLNGDGSVRGRVAGAWQDRKSFTNGYSNQRQLVYATVEADLAPGTVAMLGASYQKNDPKGSNWGGFPLWYSDGSRTDFDRSVTTAPRWAAWATEQTNVHATLEHALGQGWKAQAQAMYSKHTEDTPLVFLAERPDRITGLGMLGYPNRYIGARDQSSADVKLSGPFTLGGRQHEVIVGANYTVQHAEFSVKEALDPEPIGNFLAWDGSYPQPAWGELVLSEKYTTKQYGAYGAARLNLAEHTKLILGGRLTRWDKDRIGFDGGARFAFAKSKFVPYAGVVIDLNETYSAYASYTDIFRPQENQDRAGAWLDPLTGQSMEVGLKGELAGGRANGSIGIFEIKQDKLAQPDGAHRVPGTTTQAYYAARGATSRGIEGELSGRLAPGWNVTASASHFRAQDREQQDINTLSPRSTARLFTTWKVRPDLTVGGGVNWQSKFYFDDEGPDGKERVTQEAYSTVSLMATYQLSRQLTAQLNVENALDKKYININTYAQGTYGVPRSVRGTLTYRF
ncbi:TonB-dependent siderophore receptor [Janthinobacterium sp. EB271-G4-7A]|uniref:TonB-dependent siderophore receptor n=1 Tax=Janthinobacterium sp. EB271-G4-7A TaxID=2775056 RepID=UPI001E3FFC37|nr:TonB-dependent receptor [Janthinobacterium sp. EB271-G4-7A]